MGIRMVIAGLYMRGWSIWRARKIPLSARDADMKWLRNCWYQAGWADELSAQTPLTRVILDQPLLLFRDAEGAPRILLDRCPHRFAPLSAGRLEHGVITCGYHGLAFDGSGACVRNPHGPVTRNMRVLDFPALERHGAIWVWMGAPGKADPALLPDLSFFDESPQATSIRGWMPTAANYQLLADNILDLSHTDFLHPDTLGGMMTGAKATTRETPESVVITWFAADCIPSAAYRALLPPGVRADKWIEVKWSPPAMLVLRTATTPAGVPSQDGDITATIHSLTPETATTTHYFFNNVRRFLVDDAAFHEALRANIHRAFADEDKPMLEQQQARMGGPDLWALKPLLLPIDGAAVRVRRQLDARIQAEDPAV
jgi:vanillate O-demethylase monooxygenase subunit